MRFGFINDFETQVGIELAPGSTTLEVTAGGAEFADASATKQYVLTIAERDIRGVDLRREIVYVTGRTLNTLTVIRAREGTTAQTWPVGSPVECRASAASLENMAAADDIAQAISDHEAAADPHPQYQMGVQDNMTATADPGVSDDSAAGYSTRSRWYNTASGEAFLCVDATPGAAVWVKATLTLDELGSAATADSADFEPAISGITYAQQVSITGPALDLTDGAAESIVTVPSGHRLYLDSLDLVVASADTVSGAPEVQAGPDSGTPDTYLAATALSGSAEGDRDVLGPLVSAGVTAVRFSVAVAGSATAWTVTPVIRGYLLEM